MAGDPTQAVVDAVRTTLTGDATLMALIEGVFGHVTEAARVAYPYLVLGRRHHAQDAGAMQKDGGHVSLQIDGWSDHKGPAEMHSIHDRVYALLQRQNVTVTGYTLVQGSLMREFGDVDDEPDDDSPDRRLYHGVQLWTCEVHES
jgi:hypothetical protein